MPAQLTIKNLADISRLFGLVQNRMEFLKHAYSKESADFGPEERHNMRQEYMELERISKEF